MLIYSLLRANVITVTLPHVAKASELGQVTYIPQTPASANTPMMTMEKTLQSAMRITNVTSPGVCLMPSGGSLVAIVTHHHHCHCHQRALAVSQTKLHSQERQSVVKERAAGTACQVPPF